MVIIGQYEFQSCVCERLPRNVVNRLVSEGGRVSMSSSSKRPSSAAVGGGTYGNNGEQRTQPKNRKGTKHIQPFLRFWPDFHSYTPGSQKLRQGFVLPCCWTKQLTPATRSTNKTRGRTSRIVSTNASIASRGGHTFGAASSHYVPGSDQR